jgi:hypothetical protein
MKTLSGILVFCFVLLCATGCKKDDPGQSAADMLTAHGWQLYKLEVDALYDALPAVDNFPSMEACFKDNYLEFS